MQNGFPMIDFLERKASIHLKLRRPFRLLVCPEAFILSEEEIRLDFDFIVEMEFILLFNVLSESFLVGLKLVVEKVLFA